MGKPVYRYPDFVKEVSLKSAEGKRYWLKLQIDENKEESIVVILKNPSRAKKDVSDKTVYNVSNYIFRNRENYSQLRNIGNIVILNLFPNYETYSSQLKSLGDHLMDPENIRTLDEFCGTHTKVIMAWGNSPKGLFDEYELLKSQTMNILSKNRNELFYVDKMSLMGNPKHGQIWGYNDKLIQIC